MVQQTTILNMVPGAVKPVVHVNQYDNDTDALRFELYNGNTAFNVPSGAAVLLNGMKSDNYGFSYGANSISGNTVIFNVTRQMTALAGPVECELRVRNGELIVGTINFILFVERAALTDDTIISDTEIPLIERAVEIAAELDNYIQLTLESSRVAQEAAQNASRWADNSEIYYNTVVQKSGTIDAAVIAATEAAETIQNLSATASTLPAGSPASAVYNNGVIAFGIPKGDTGESGVTYPVPGFFTMSVDADGNLYVYCEEDLSDSFEYDSETGNLYYVVEDS